MDEEIELKLIAGPSFDEGALVQRLTGLGSLSEPRRFEQRDTYLDTASGALRAAGLSGRVRRKKTESLVDVKAVPIDPELVMRRVEICVPVAVGADPAATLRGLLERELGVQPEGELAPRLCLVTDRTVRMLEADGTEVEICVDRVKVLDARDQEIGAFGEVEAELATGDAAVLEKIAAALRDETLEPSGKAKYVRARELAGLPAYVYGGASPKFDRSMPVAEVARVVCRHQLETMRSYEPGTRVGIDTEHLHKMRVASRRLRTALRVFAAYFDEEPRVALGKELRWIGRRLGAVRDLDVHTLALPRWREELGPDPVEGWVALGERLRESRARARAKLAEALDSARWRELCAAAQQLFASASTSAPVGEAAAALIETPAEAFHAGVARFRETHAVEDAHQLRILGKRVRYTAEYLKPLLSAEARASIKRLSAFQDTLGDLQDAIAAGEFARQQAKPRWTATPALQFVLGLLAGAARVHAADARPRVDDALEALDPSGLVAAIQSEVRGG